MIAVITNGKFTRKDPPLYLGPRHCQNYTKVLQTSCKNMATN